MAILILSLITAALLQTLSAQLPQDLSEFELPHERAENLLTDHNLAAAPVAQPQSEGRAASGKRLSLNLKPELKTGPPLPQWCRLPEDRRAGPWHQLSDDEYTNESPYLLCGLPEKGQRSFNVQRSSRRRAAHAVPNKGSDRTKGCPEVLQVPKVAMMFLTQGPMPHEELWKRWLASIAGVVPTLCLANAVCARGGLPILDDVTQACGQLALEGKSVYDQQLLYSVYIHAPPDYILRNESSVFFGRDAIVSRVASKWADHSTVEAVRRMLSAALKDGANQRFILLSESCIPLYSSLVVYQQLMHEKRSRISACAVPGWDRSPERYNVRMAAGRREKGRIPADKWRKHMHWFSLTRFHAEVVSNDTDVVETFARDCFLGYDPLCSDPSKYRFCLADEHYVSTLLAVYGLDAQTDCMGHLTHADFDKQDEHPEHPKQYKPNDISAVLIRELRKADSEAIAATKFAMQSFHKVEEFTGNNTIWRIPYPQIRQLAPQFHLFARKFGSDTAKALLDLFEKTNERGEKLGIFGGTQTRDPQLETNFKQLVKGH